MLGAPIEVEDTVARLHRESLVIDLHNDLLTKLVLRGGNLGKRHGAQALYNPLAFDIDVPKLKEGGVDGLGCLLFAGMNLLARQRFWRQLEVFGELFDKHPELVRVGSAAELETADVALMADELPKISYAIRLSRATARNIRVNIGFSLVLKAAFLVMAIAGAATLWMAVAADMGASLLVVANALRLLRE